MESKFSPLDVWYDFWKFYKNEKKVLIFIPLLVSFLISFIVKIDINLINLLLFALSIFIGFLLNLMLMSFNLKDDTIKPIEVNGKLYYLSDVLEEYHCTISFEILITIFLVIFMLAVSLIYKCDYVSADFLIYILRFLFNFVVCYLLILFFLILFRVLKFGHILLEYYIKN